jgi:uncharacterized protein
MPSLCLSVPSIEETPRRFQLEAGAEWWEHVSLPPELRPLRVLQPMALEIEAYRIGRRLLIRGELRSVVEVACGRCAEPYSHGFREPVTLLLEPLPTGADVPEGGIELDPDDMALGRYGGEELDFAPVLLEAVLTAWPMQPRCEEDCKGLCPTCGENLNVGACSCEGAKVNRPFEGLGELLSGARGRARPPKP